MSALQVLASLPCVGSLKCADTIIRELAGRGLAITFAKLPTEAAMRAAEKPFPPEINVPLVIEWPNVDP